MAHHSPEQLNTNRVYFTECYKVAVNVVDIFGNDTMKIVGVTV